MENKLPTISTARTMLLLANYFICYLFLYPFLFAKLTLYFDPTAVIISMPLQYIAYGLTFASTLWLAYPMLVQSYERMKGHGKEHVMTILTHVFVILALNVALSLLISMFTNTTTSTNQSEIVQSSYIQPLLNLIVTVGFAPFVEECVFRGGVFLKLREKLGFFWSALISGFLFGLIHVMSSLSAGDYADVMYVIVYAGIGFLLAYTLEKTKTVYACMAVHAISNLVALILIYI